MTRTRVVLLLLLALLLPLAPSPASAAEPILFGAAQAAVPGSTKLQAIRALEGATGRSLAVIRHYDMWDDQFPSTTETALRDSGHTLLLSVKAKRRDGRFVLWRDIAAAQPGSPLHDDMVRWATALRDFDGPVQVSFNHEAETSSSRPSGSAAEYVAAARAFTTVLRAHPAPKVRIAWIAAVRNFSVRPTASSYAPPFYPGDAWVDDLAVDAYNMYCLRRDGRYSRPWRSLEELLRPWMAFVAEHPGPGLVVAEFGSPEDPDGPGRKAQWIDDAAALFQRPEYARIRMVAYWNQLSHNFAGCDFRVTSSPSALEAFRRMAAEPYYAATAP